MKNNSRYRVIRWIFPGFLYFLAITAILSCKKKDNNTMAGTSAIITVNFTDNFINPKLGAIVFISDTSGNTLADTLVSGNGKVAVMPLPGAKVPERFTVTLVLWEPGMHNFTITLNSFLGISTGEWTVQGHRADTTGHFIFSMQNIPAHTGPILYSISGSSNVTFLTTGLDTWLYKDPDALYIMLRTASGPKFKWITGVTNNGDYSADLSNMDNAISHQISLPFTAQNYLVTLRGFKDNYYETPLNWRCDEIISEGIPVSSLSVSYPDGAFNGFSTALEIAENYVTPYTYTYHADGTIPDLFKKIDATVLLATPGQGQATIQTNGTYTMTNMSWIFNAWNRQSFVWNVFGPDSIRTIKLPKLSADAGKMFPELAIDSLTFMKAELTNFWNISSYDNLVKQVFDPLHPHEMDHLEGSSIRYVPGK
jgi:hypothetical protein